MSNDTGNPQIVEHGRATRFGVGRNCPLAAQRQASPPWSTRRAVQRIARTTFDVPDGVGLPIPTRKTLCHALTGSGRFLTGAEVLAVELWQAAFSGDLGAMQRLTKMIDGDA